MKLLKIVEEKRRIIEELKGLDEKLMIKKLNNLADSFQEDNEQIEDIDIDLLYIIAEQFLFTRFDDKFGDWVISCKGYKKDAHNTTEMKASKDDSSFVLTSNKHGQSNGEIVDMIAKNIVIKYIKDPYFCIDISDNKYPSSILYKQYRNYAI